MKRQSIIDLKSLEEKIDSYFSYCDSFNCSEKGEIVKPYTLSGLLCYTGITKREFDDLCTSRRYRKPLLAAKAKIEAFIEENALTGEISCNASLNSLKYHFGWGEKPEKDSADTGSITVSLSHEDEQLAR